MLRFEVTRKNFILQQQLRESDPQYSIWHEYLNLERETAVLACSSVELRYKYYIEPFVSGYI